MANLHSLCTYSPPLSTAMCLPNELVVDIFLHLARLDPHSLARIARVCRHWQGIVCTFESVLWQTATVCTFPCAYSMDLGLAKGIWKKRFRIQDGWHRRQGQTLSLRPHRMTEEAVEGPLTLLQSEQQHHHHHQHDHHHLQQVEASSNLSRSYDSVLEQEPRPLNHLEHRSSQSHALVKSALPPVSPLAVEPQEMLSCSLCTYADICLIPQARIAVRTHRHRYLPRMQVLDWSLTETTELDPVHAHQDLVSGMAVNEEGTLMTSCSIDGTVRVWDVVVDSPSLDRVESFKDRVRRLGCPLQNRHLLMGHVGWVNAVAIEKTTVVSGGSDHTIRVWDAITGTQVHVIQDLYRTRDVGLGVYSIAIQGSVIGSGSVLEGYQLHDLATGETLFELDEPLSSKDHFRFESHQYQHYASRIALIPTGIVTNSKKKGMLCVWDRHTGRFLYRIQVYPVHPTDKECNRKIEDIKMKAMTTTENTDPFQSLSTRREAVGATDGQGDAEEEAAIHTFKVNQSGSMLICTLCDGRVSLFDFEPRTASDMSLQDSWRIESAGPPPQQQPCGALLAWIWTRQGHDSQDNHVKLV